MDTSLFITGTDTGVGKTVLAASLLAAARSAGAQAAPMKPVQTGCAVHGGHLRAPDLDFCLCGSSMQVSETVYRDMAPYCYEPACSPHLAARQAGSDIEQDVILTAFRRLAADYDQIFIEGAGGVLVPISEAFSMLDLMKAFDLPVVLAARSSLGTLNHTQLSLQALRHADVRISGVVLVDSAQTVWGEIEEDNRRTIEALSEVRVLGVLPYVEGIGDSATLPEKLLDAGREILARI